MFACGFCLCGRGGEWSKEERGKKETPCVYFETEIFCLLGFSFSEIEFLYVAFADLEFNL